MPIARSSFEDALRQHLRASLGVMRVLAAARDARIPDWRLFSGAVYQTVWNALTNRPLDYGVRDYDLGYFDPDLTEAAEARNQVQVSSRLPEDMRGRVEVVNQARVHLWFEEKFGRPYPRLICTDDALRRSLFTAHAVGVRLEADDAISIAAPYGLDDIFAMVLRPNPESGFVAAHAEKAREAMERWPEVSEVGQTRRV